MTEPNAATPRGPETELSMGAGEARDFPVVAGQLLSVAVEAEPLVGSLFAFASEDQTEALSVGNSRILLGTLRPRPGDRLFSNRRRALFEWLDDSSSVHDLLMPVAACARDRATCRARLNDALTHVGADPAHPPDPLNLFMNVEVGANGHIRLGEPVARAGDHVILRATLSLSCVLLVWAQDGLQCLKGSGGTMSVAIRNRLGGAAKRPHA